MTILYEHTDRDENRLVVSTVKDYFGEDYVVVDTVDPYGEAGVGVYVPRAALVAALGAVPEQEFADMSTLAKKNLARYETALAERDRARDTAARLEAENADLAATCERQRVELARINGHGASTGDQPDPWAETHRLLTSILDAVTALKPRVTKTRVEYRTTGNVADIIDALSRCEQDGRLRDLGCF